MLGQEQDGVNVNAAGQQPAKTCLTAPTGHPLGAC